jgi:NACalpha-BTF3-like transcription factor
VNSWKVILATLVIFGAGVITGGLLVSYAVHSNAVPQRYAQQPQPNAPTPWQLRNKELLRRMERELGLTTAQRSNIEKIITDSQDRTKTLWKPIVPQMNKEMQHVHVQIREALTSDQQTKFDEMIRPRPVKKLEDTNSPVRLRDLKRNTNVPAAELPTAPANP